MKAGAKGNFICKESSPWSVAEDRGTLFDTLYPYRKNLSCVGSISRKTSMSIFLPIIVVESMWHFGRIVKSFLRYLSSYFVKYEKLFFVGKCVLYDCKTDTIFFTLTLLWFMHLLKQLNYLSDVGTSALAGEENLHMLSCP